MVEEDFPTWATPNGMIFGSKAERAKPQAAGILEVGDHLLGKVFVLADQEVNVIRHDGAGVTGISIVLDDVSERFSDA